MKKEIILAGAAALIAFGSTSADAQSAIEGYTKTKGITYTMVRDHFQCGGPTLGAPAAQTLTGTPACQPVTLRDGGPTGRYTVDKAKGGIEVKFTGKIEKDCQKFDPAAIAGPCFNATIAVKGKGILGTDGNPYTSTAPAEEFSLNVTVEATIADRVGGDMTVVPFQIIAQIPVAQGKMKVKTTSFAILSESLSPQAASLPDALVIEAGVVEILDPDGLPFAVPGVSTLPK